ncbi:hypothetical protein EV356DRAFT_527920 [Viridothelium virens]|uniref:Calcium channel YVC1-like C-terminal transmembrane domain-containing protein n=1 Tax=Viridothelium virens TaxID=1048519 RepID=A0A6A6HPY0_VIRVR|nr:hypothetical protein EV356DRAFT_527920 [Viridothelium virens]
MSEPARVTTPLRKPYGEDHVPIVPQIHENDPFIKVVKKLSGYILDAVEGPQTFEELQTVAYGHKLTPLIESLINDVHNRDIVSALLVLKAHFSSLEINDDKAINNTRGFACEIVAWRFVAHLSERESIDFLLHDVSEVERQYYDEEGGLSESSFTVLVDNEDFHDDSARIPNPSNQAECTRDPNGYGNTSPDQSMDTQSEREYLASFKRMNALEIAVVAGAKKFLSQKTVQKVVNGIWNGEIVFWENMSVHSRKEAKFYNRRKADPYCRLRVPKYLKSFEAAFFASFLALYYAVLVERNIHKINVTEILLYIWIASFEFGEFLDAGSLFYAADFWSLWDIGIILVGAAFFTLRMIGLVKGNGHMIDISFDILSIEALFLVPRVFSLLSLNRYVGTLIPCLKEMTKDFIKFLGLVVILYFGFLTTFTLLARDYFTPLEMSWILINVFFGSSYLGFDIAQKISPILGPPLMLIFVCLTNILLITSLISLLSNSLTKVMEHAGEEYCLTYSIFVLEASTSNRLTYFLPPLNLLALAFRPLRLCIPSGHLRSARIVLLKVTHFPFVVAIEAYERWQQFLARRQTAGAFLHSSFGGPSTRTRTTSSLRPRGMVVGKDALFRTSLSSARPLTAAEPSAGRVKQHDSAQWPSLDPPRTAPSSSELNDEVRDLRAMVVRLGAQVEGLTAVMTQQQQQHQSITDEEI